jgi:hypothetical protein
VNPPDPWTTDHPRSLPTPLPGAVQVGRPREPAVPDAAAVPRIRGHVPAFGHHRPPLAFASRMPGAALSVSLRARRAS